MENTLDEIIEKYCDVELSFTRYYKYKFTFAGKLPDGRTITILTGGGDIYMSEFSAKEKIGDLDFTMDDVEIK